MTELTPEQEIDEILETYATYIYSEAPDFYVPAGIKYDCINKKEAKKRLLTLKKKWETEAYKKGYIQAGIDNLTNGDK